MAYIKINTKYPVYDGAPLTFRAPCDCTETDGISVNSKNFVFKDAHGVALTGMGNLFVKDAVVKVILDVTNSSAYIQNADTNSYLENKDADCVVNQYEVPREFVYNSNGEIVGGLDWCVREWKSGYVECCGLLYIGHLSLVSYSSGVYSCPVNDVPMFGPYKLPVALDSGYNYSVQASVSSDTDTDFLMISLGRIETQDPTIPRLIITHTPKANVWSPIQQSLNGCRVNFCVTGQKIVD